MPRPLSLAITASLLTLASVANAESGPHIALRLEYEAPDKESCPTAESFALMLAGEFGYLVVRPDVAPLLRVQIRKKGKDLEAETWAPHPNGVDEEWHGITEDRVSCRELVYDLAYAIRLHLGPNAWPNGEVPAHLAAPPEMTVGSVRIIPLDRARLDPQRPLGPPPDDGANRMVLSTKPKGIQVPLPMYLTATAAAMVAPYGLSKFAVGGGGSLSLRWVRFALGGELRGLWTPESGIGEPSVPGQTSIFVGALHPCLLVPHIDICGCANVSKLSVNLPYQARTTSTSRVTFGFGVRVVGRVKLDNTFSFAGFGEVTGETENITLLSLPENQVGTISTWQSPSARVLFGIGIETLLF